jgi:hypothetical protein
MANLLGFDATDVQPSRDFEPVPAGKYLSVITDSEMMPTKAGTGHYLQLTFQLIDGEYQNRVLWARLNLDNPNQAAVEIAQAELSAICRAVGVLQPRDSCELHNLPLVITVKCRKREDSGEIANEIKGYSKKDQPAPAVGTAPASPSTPPWKRA